MTVTRQRETALKTKPKAKTKKKPIVKQKKKEDGHAHSSATKGCNPSSTRSGAYHRTPGHEEDPYTF